VASGDDVLDVACGTGNATIPAAQRGAKVVGLDLTPELLKGGRAAAAEAGVEIDWIEGDAEALPFEDQSFDAVLSVFGAMFAPHHAVAAAEIARVLRPGGRMALANWTPDGNIGTFFATVGSHMPPPPEGFQPPPLWGTEDHVRGLFEGTGVELSFESAVVNYRFDSAEHVMDFFEHKFGPVVMAKAALEPEGKWEALRADLVAMYEGFGSTDEGDFRFPGQYLLTTGTKES
jgi:SAM-dependent methyltransferase